MHLLSTQVWKDGAVNLQLKRFTGQNLPQYAILSHTWARDDEDEVSFPDVKEGVISEKPGLAKVISAATQAQKDGYEYIWIDTCCIDKSSSAELSEAINSMFTCYQNAAVCYVYLEDVSSDVDVSAEDSELSKARWFTRGWTLQELLASRHLIFFSKNWEAIGDKGSLSQIISRITTIHHEVLLRLRPIEAVSTAERMSWAAHRTTTRPEDVAYCLMGIFSVNMSLLYGEGEKAFHRLQRKIMKNSDDRTLFAWVDPMMDDRSVHGLLADHPRAFSKQHCYEIHRHERSTTHEWTNRGVQIELELARIDYEIYAASLDCVRHSEGTIRPVAIHLLKLESDKPRYARIRCSTGALLSPGGHREIIHVQQHYPRSTLGGIDAFDFFQLAKGSFKHSGYVIVNTFFHSDKARDAESLSYSPQPDHGWSQKDQPIGRLMAAILLRRSADGESLIIMFGFNSQGHAGFAAMEYHPDKFCLEGLSSLREKFKPVPSCKPVHLQSHLVEVVLRPSRVGASDFCEVDIGIVPKKAFSASP